MMRAMVLLVVMAACNSASREPKRDLAFMPSTTQAAKDLCAHLAALGCEQRTECVKERDFHLATRDMRIECVMAAQDLDSLAACGTVTCAPLPKAKP